MSDHDQDDDDLGLDGGGLPQTKTEVAIWNSGAGYLWGVFPNSNGGQSYHQVGTVDRDGTRHYYTKDGAIYTDAKGNTISFTKEGDEYVAPEGKIVVDENGARFIRADGTTVALKKDGDQFVAEDGSRIALTKAGQEYAQKFPDRVVVGGRDFNSGSKTYDYETVMNGTDPAQKTMREGLLKLKEHMQGEVKSGQMYASINEGKLYILAEDSGKLKIKEFHFVSGSGHANDPRYEATFRQGPAPASLAGDYYDVVTRPGTMHGDPAYKVLEHGHDNLHNGRSAIRMHTVGASGVTWGCFGFTHGEMLEINALLGNSGKYRLVIGNTKLAAEAAARAGMTQNASLGNIPPISRNNKDFTTPSDIKVLYEHVRTEVKKTSDGKIYEVEAGNSKRGPRNANYGNLEAVSLGSGAPVLRTQRQPGYVGVEHEGRYAVFANPVFGILAADALLTYYASSTTDDGKPKTPKLSVADIVYPWAPPGENNTRDYIQQVAGRLGIPENAPVPLNKRGALLYEMFTAENGRPPFSAQQIQYIVDHRAEIVAAWESKRSVIPTAAATSANNIGQMKATDAADAAAKAAEQRAAEEAKKVAEAEAAKKAAAAKGDKPTQSASANSVPAPAA